MKGSTIMTDLSTTDRITNDWQALGIPFSPELKSAIAQLEAVRWAEVGHVPRPDIDGLTAKNAEQRIVELAHALSLGSEFGAGLGPLERAKAAYLDICARGVLGAMREMIPTAIEIVSERLETGSAIYVASIAKLPARIDAESILAHNASEAFNQARSAAGVLESVDGFASGLQTLSGVISRDADPVLRIVRPDNPGDLAALDAARNRTATPTEHQLGGAVWIEAARRGVRFAVNTASGAKALRSRLTRPQPTPALAAR
jgi:hypothetical protein